MGRHGPGRVVQLAFDALRQQGLVATLRLASDDRPFLSVVKSAAKSQPRDVLDEFGAVGAKAYAQWSQRAPRTKSASAPGAIGFVIAPAGEGTGPLEQTRSALRAAFPEAPIHDVSTDWTPSGLDPAVFHLFMRAGDLPEASLSAAVADAFADPACEILTFDMVRRAGGRAQPLLLPGANLPLLQDTDSIASRAFLRGAALAKAGAGPRDSILTWCGRRPVQEIRAGWRHLPQVLLDVDLSDAEMVERRRLPSARPGSTAATADPVSVVICTKDKGHLVRQLTRQLLVLGSDQVAEILIVSNGTTNPYALRALADLSSDPRVRILRRDAPFNFARLCNDAANETAGGGPLLFLNDDIAPVSEDWLSVLRDRLLEPGVGAVGPLLLYPDERVQHAGMYLRFPSGAGHYLRGAALPSEDVMGLANAAREVTCLTGAVLLTRRDAFEAIGGFDEQLAISFQDVDYGLKLYSRGLRSVFEPRSILIHMESVSLARANADPELLRQRHAERALMLARWAAAFPTDPFLPAGLAPQDEGLRKLVRP
jgi:GT2 family glycosyltransferase